MIQNCKIGKGTKIYPFVNIYECEVGKNCMIGNFVEIQKGVKIGDKSRISSHSFLCSGVVVGDNVFIGHGVMTINDLYPKCSNKNWKCLKTIIGDNTIIGSNATLLPVKIGKNVLIGAGTVVTKDIPDNAVVIGSPAKIIRYKKENK